MQCLVDTPDINAASARKFDDYRHASQLAGSDAP
jgi:hypothetical protein